MTCKCARRTDEYHGWACGITGGACMFVLPDSKRCAAVYGEGPDSEKWKNKREKEPQNGEKE